MKGCLTIGVSYERVTAKSKAFVQEKFVLEPDSVYQRRVVGRTGSHVFIRIKVLLKVGCHIGLRRISSSPGSFHLNSFLLSSFRSSSVSKN